MLPILFLLLTLIPGTMISVLRPRDLAIHLQRLEVHLATAYYEAMETRERFEIGGSLYEPLQIGGSEHQDGLDLGDQEVSYVDSAMPNDSRGPQRAIPKYSRAFIWCMYPQIGDSDDGMLIFSFFSHDRPSNYPSGCRAILPQRRGLHASCCNDHHRTLDVWST